MTSVRKRAAAGRLASLCLLNLCLLASASLAALSVSARAEEARQATTPNAASTVGGRIEAAMRELKDDPRYKGLSDEQRRDNIEFVSGNMIFATVHEVGHMLIAEMGLPVLGREEDAADSFATITGLKLAGPLSDRILTQSARGWFMSDQRNQKQKVKTVFYDEHGLDRQRAYNIVCLMVGGNPEKFSKLADMTKLPEERQGTCQGDFSNASWSWNKALEPHIRKADQPKTNISVVYSDTKKYAVYQRGFREIRLLEILAEHLSDRFGWRGPISLVMEECGEPAARWDLSDRKIHICYELAVDFADMYRNYGGEQKTQKAAARKHKR